MCPRPARLLALKVMMSEVTAINDGSSARSFGAAEASLVVDPVSSINSQTSSGRRRKEAPKLNPGAGDDERSPLLPQPEDHLPEDKRLDHPTKYVS